MAVQEAITDTIMLLQFHLSQGNLAQLHAVCWLLNKTISPCISGAINLTAISPSSACSPQSKYLLFFFLLSLTLMTMSLLCKWDGLDVNTFQRGVQCFTSPPNWLNYHFQLDPIFFEWVQANFRQCQYTSFKYWTAFTFQKENQEDPSVVWYQGGNETRTRLLKFISLQWRVAENDFVPQIFVVD